MALDDKALEKLKALAEKATPGPWRETCGAKSGRAYGIHAGGPVRANIVNFGGLSRAASEQGQANAAFIAACSPDVILGLVELALKGLAVESAPEAPYCESCKR